ncbi:MAG: hypothetical protein Q9196_007388, partial [Gyalolechia fulgens]
SAESDGISSSSERLRDQPLGTPTAQTSFYQPSVDLGQTAPHHGPSHTSSISNPTPGSSTKEAFSTTAENPIPTAHRLDHSPLISEQPQISECVTPHLSRGGSAEASGWFPDGPNAHYIAGPVTDPPPDTRPSAEDSEQISSIYHTQKPVIEHPGDTLRHSAEHTRDLLAAAEAGGSAWYKPKRTRSSSSSTSAEMTVRPHIPLPSDSVTNFTIKGPCEPGVGERTPRATQYVPGLGRSINPVPSSEVRGG